MAKYVVDTELLEPIAFDVSSVLTQDFNVGHDVRGVTLSEIKAVADREIVETGLTLDDETGECRCDICGERMGFYALRFRFCPFCSNEIRGGIKNGRKSAEDKS